MYSFSDNGLGIILGLYVGIITVSLLTMAGVYILSSLAYQKALEAMNYKNAWLAWIPYGRYYALAECTRYDEVTLIVNVTIPMQWFKIWWILEFIPIVGLALMRVGKIFCLGWCFTKIYAYLDNKEDSDVQVWGYLSAIFGIIPLIKFLCIKK